MLIGMPAHTSASQPAPHVVKIKRTHLAAKGTPSQPGRLLGGRRVIQRGVGAERE